MIESGCLTVGNVNLGSNRLHDEGRRTMQEPNRNTWKLLSSENITFLHCSGVQWACFLANARLCFFIRSVLKGFLAALRLGKPKSFWRRCWTVRIFTFWSRFFKPSAVNRGFFCSSLFMMASVTCHVFLLLPPPYLWFGIALLGSPLPEARSFIMVDFALPLRSLMTFIGTFSCLHARIRAFSSPLVYFPGMPKYTSKNNLLYKILLWTPPRLAWIAISRYLKSQNNCEASTSLLLYSVVNDPLSTYCES